MSPLRFTLIAVIVVAALEASCYRTRQGTVCEIRFEGGQVRERCRPCLPAKTTGWRQQTCH